MDLHQALQTAGGVLALLLFIPMFLGVLKHGAQGQSFATWLLWGALDTILVISIVRQHGNFLLPLGFTLGDLVLVGLLLARGKFLWSRVDTITLVLVLACLVAWKLGGSKTATIAATLGIAIAGIPGTIALWKHPQRGVGNVWIGYTLANLISFFGGRTMTIEERFAPAVFTLCSLGMVIASRQVKSSSQR